MSRHYATPALIAAGYAVFGQNSRWLNNDALCVHETLLLDVAAGVRFLRERGFERVVLDRQQRRRLAVLLLHRAVVDAAARAPARDAGRRPARSERLRPAAGRRLRDARRASRRGPHPHADDRSVGDRRARSAVLRSRRSTRSTPTTATASRPRRAATQPSSSQRYRAAQRDRVARLDAIAAPASRARATQARADARRAPTSPPGRGPSRRARCAPRSPIRTWSSSAPRPICAPSISRSIRPSATPARCSPIAPISPTTWSSASPASPRRAPG